MQQIILQHRFASSVLQHSQLGDTLSFIERLSLST